MDDLLKEYCEIAKKIAIEEGRAEGEAKGRAEGRAEGESIGEAKEKFATAKRLLTMKLSIQDISKATTLPVVKIQELQAEMLHTNA